MVKSIFYGSELRVENFISTISLSRDSLEVRGPFFIVLLFHMNAFTFFYVAHSGAPIVATINGRRHEIRLAGPAPDVKINPDPAYELTAELNRIRANKSENKPGGMGRTFREYLENGKPSISEPSLDPFNLLKKLQQSGFLKKPEPAPAPAPSPSTRDRLRQTTTMLRDSTPPIPSEHRYAQCVKAMNCCSLVLREATDDRVL